MNSTFNIKKGKPEIEERKGHVMARVHTRLFSIIEGFHKGMLFSNCHEQKRLFEGNDEKRHGEI